MPSAQAHGFKAKTHDIFKISTWADLFDGLLTNLIDKAAKVSEVSKDSQAHLGASSSASMNSARVNPS